METEEGLVERARNGSSEAFTALVRAHQSRVRAYLGSWLRRPDVVDDVAQETFLDAYKRLHAYRGEAPVAHWLLGIARNCALRYLQGESRRRGHVREAEAALADAVERRLQDEPESEHDRKVAALDDCLAKLPDPGARLVTAFYFDRRPASELARDSGRSEGAIWMMLLRLRQVLRTCMESSLEVSEPT